MLPLLGAISVFPGRFDSQSISTIRRYVADMPHPVALAPEGQVTYHNERVAALESGTAQLAFWCMEDLKKQSRTEEVLIVPVCTSYHYDPRDWKGLLRLLAKIEQRVRLSPAGGAQPPGGSRVRMPPDDEAREKIHVRVMRISRHLVDIAEDFYGRFYGVVFPAAREEETTADAAGAHAGRVRGGALHRGTLLPREAQGRLRAARARRAAWRVSAWIYRDDIPDPDGAARASSARLPTGSPRRAGCACGTWSSSMCWSTCARTTCGLTPVSTGSWSPSPICGTS